MSSLSLVARARPSGRPAPRHALPPPTRLGAAPLRTRVGRELRGPSWVVLVSTAVAGVLLVGWSYRLSGSGAAPGVYYPTFWAGLLLAVLPVSARLVGRHRSELDRAGAVVLLGVLTAVPKYLRNPAAPLYHDEYAHWRQAVDVLAGGRLNVPNSLIPIVQFFPGTSALTVGVERLTGLSLWSSGQLVVAVLHVLSLVAVYLIAETHLGSSRAGAVAAVVYAVNPSAVYFDTQYAYESVAMGLFLWVLALGSLAGRTPVRRHRRGLSAAAAAGVAGCVVTHHLTTVFLLAVLGILAVGTTVVTAGRRRRGAPQEGRERTVWWTLFATAVMVAGLWVTLVATPTIAYLSPYFGGSLTQLAAMTEPKGDGGGRQLLAASVQPQWERGLTALAPLLVGVLCLIGVVRLWRERRLWPAATLALVAFGLIYFPSVPFVLAPSGAEGARRSWGFSYVGVAVLVALVVAGVPRRNPARRIPARRSRPAVERRRTASAGLLILVAVLLVGNVGGGLNDPYRFPGPFRWGTDTNSASDEARTVARQLAAQQGRVRVVTDAYTSLQLVAYGGLDVAAPSAGFPAWDLTQTPADPPAELARMLVGSQYDYLVVDDRMAAQPPYNGHNYGSGDPLLGRATPQAYLDRLDHVPWASRIMATEHLRVYRLDLVRLGAVVREAS